jgi:hypothetical protein
MCTNRTERGLVSDLLKLFAPLMVESQTGRWQSALRITICGQVTACGQRFEQTYNIFRGSLWTDSCTL